MNKHRNCEKFRGGFETDMSRLVILTDMCKTMVKTDTLWLWNLRIFFCSKTNINFTKKYHTKLYKYKLPLLVKYGIVITIIHLFNEYQWFGNQPKPSFQIFPNLTTSNPNIWQAACHSPTWWSGDLGVPIWSCPIIREYRCLYPFYEYITQFIIYGS